MSKKNKKVWRYCWPALHTDDSQGFTLMELLIAVIISGLVVSGLLFIVVELLRIDNRETALEEVQRDTQRAMNYIADDLREAVYVYTDPSDVVSVATTTGIELPIDFNPVLAFWKVRHITRDEQGDIPVDCDAAFSTPALSEKRSECDILKIRRATYDLVIYSQITGASDPWKGQSRITRFVMEQYNDFSTLTWNTGYNPPSNTFNPWQRKIGDPSPTNNSVVLTDYISVPSTPPGSTAPPAVNCANDNFAGSAGYQLSPTSATVDDGFFVCVRDVNVPDANNVLARSNQDVFLFLKGDVSGRSSSVSPASRASRAPALKTQVLIHGVLNKNPTD